VIPVSKQRSGHGGNGKAPTRQGVAGRLMVES
jgi:hypothetical protein